MNHKDETLHLFSWIGVCLLVAQQAERVFVSSISMVLNINPKDAEGIFSEHQTQQKATLGQFVKALGKTHHIDKSLKKDLWDFVKKRNTLVHNVNEIPGWNLKTKEGMDVAFEFVVSLALLSLRITGLFTTVVNKSAQIEYGQTELPGSKLLTLLDEKFGAKAEAIIKTKAIKPLSSIQLKAPRR